MAISRRTFIETAALGGAASAALAATVDKKTGMPMRTLGRTGAQVSIIGLGCGSRLLMYKDEDKALEAGEKALAMGINYFDSAQGYGNGTSEKWVGKILKGRRKGAWVVTKIQKRKADEALRMMDESLKNLQTDHVDLAHIHALAGADDVAAIEAKGGLLEAMYKIRDQKMARFIGVTSHTDPVALKTLLERHDFDCTQMALNVALVGMRNGQGGMEINPEMKDSFEKIALPVALKKKMGVTAMKIFAQGPLVGKAPTEKLIRYALTLPVTAAILGMPKLDYISENAAVAKAFKPLPKSEMQSLGDELSKAHKASLDRFFRDHIDA